MEFARLARILDAISVQTPLVWSVSRGAVRIGERSMMAYRYLRDVDIPSAEDYEDAEDRETFRALSRPVEADLDGARTIPELIRLLGKAAKVPVVLADGLGEDGDTAIDSLGLFPSGPKVIPVLVLDGVRPRIDWRIRKGMLAVSLRHP